MITIATAELGPTATYHKRACAWVSNGSGTILHTTTLPNGEQVEQELPGLGKLTIRVQKAKGYGRACEIDTYAVAETEPQHPGTRAFMLLNLDDPEQREPYLVHVGGVDTCRCMAGKCRVASGCKHRDALSKLIEMGFLEPELMPQPEPFVRQSPLFDPIPF